MNASCNVVPQIASLAADASWNKAHLLFAAGEVSCHLFAFTCIAFFSWCVLQVGAALYRSHGNMHFFRNHKRFCRVILCLGEYYLLNHRQFSDMQ